MTSKFAVGDIVEIDEPDFSSHGKIGTIQAIEAPFVDYVARIQLEDGSEVEYNTCYLKLRQSALVLPAAASTVQCFCGYDATDHDDEGNCPGDGYAGQPAALAEGDGEQSDAYRLESMATEIVHAQMVLQTALGYNEVDYKRSLSDLSEDIEELVAANAALMRERDGLRAALQPFASLGRVILNGTIDADPRSAITNDMLTAAADALRAASE